MASRYLKWKHRDVQPEQAVELTPRQKWANWWDYHKWYVLLGVALLALAIYLGSRALGAGQVLPDYQVAYVGSTALPEETATARTSRCSAVSSSAEVTACTASNGMASPTSESIRASSPGEG